MDRRGFFYLKNLKFGICLLWLCFVSASSACLSGEYEYWDGSCSKTCQYPLKISGPKCLFPCDATQYLYHDQTCSATCQSPFVEKKDELLNRKFCFYACNGNQAIDSVCTCAVGTYKDSAKCVACPQYCEECTKTTCSRCTSGTVKSFNSQCVPICADGKYYSLKDGCIDPASSIKYKYKQPSCLSPSEIGFDASACLAQSLGNLSSNKSH